jgi:hypothetical protein
LNRSPANSYFFRYRKEKLRFKTHMRRRVIANDRASRSESSYDKVSEPGVKSGLKMAAKMHPLENAYHEASEDSTAVYTDAASGGAGGKTQESAYTDAAAADSGRPAIAGESAYDAAASGGGGRPAIAGESAYDAAASGGGGRQAAAGESAYDEAATGASVGENAYDEAATGASVGENAYDEAAAAKAIEILYDEAAAN